MPNRDTTIRELSDALRSIMDTHTAIDLQPANFGGQVLTPGEMHVLAAIGRAPGINVRDLAGLRRVTKSAASQMATRLAGRGLVEKRPSAESNKELELWPTGPGRDALAAHRRMHKERDAELSDRLARFSDAQLAQARAVLAEIDVLVARRLAELMNG